MKENTNAIGIVILQTNPVKILFALSSGSIPKGVNKFDILSEIHSQFKYFTFPSREAELIFSIISNAILQAIDKILTQNDSQSLKLVQMFCETRASNSHALIKLSQAEIMPEEISFKLISVLKNMLKPLNKPIMNNSSNRNRIYLMLDTRTHWYYHTIRMVLQLGGAMKILSLKLPEPLFAKLTSAAKERGENRSALVREAIKAFIKGNNHAPKDSCLDLAKDLAGCVNGPVDLSFNKKRMHGYGQ